MTLSELLDQASSEACPISFGLRELITLVFKSLKLDFLPLGILTVLTNISDKLSLVVSIPFWTMIQLNGMFSEERPGG